MERRAAIKLQLIAQLGPTMNFVQLIAICRPASPRVLHDRSRFRILIHPREHQTRLCLGFGVLYRVRTTNPFFPHDVAEYFAEKAGIYAVATLRRHVAAISKATVPSALVIR